jgi:trehalose 6-phosphate synthase
MPRLFGFISCLVIGLALLAWGAALVVSRTTQAWFERDIGLRAQLVVKGARYSLLSRWTQSGEAVEEILREITHDERILAAAACRADGTPVAHTPGFPDSLPCAGLAKDFQTPIGNGFQLNEVSGFARTLPHGEVYVNIVPLPAGEQVFGFVVLVHDLTFIERREARARRLVLIAFVVLSVTACLATIIAGRMFWRDWTREMRQAIKGEGKRRDFQPLLGDLRDLVRRMSAEIRSDAETGVWNPKRLRGTLKRDLQGERVVVVANREPYIHERAQDGSIRVVLPASGLVTALEPVMRACSGVWIAHGSGSADRQVVDASDRVRVPPGEESYSLRRVWMSAEEEAGYYYGFSNEGLWPLCHLAHTRPVFRGEDWNHYRTVNERFANAVSEEAQGDDPIILVQDYHFALAPAMIRSRLPRATILSFWHVPWPNAERLGICPWRGELVSGMLGSSIMGFQTRSHCNNFLEGVDRYLEARIDREQIAVVQNERVTLVRDYPISIEWPSHWAQTSPSTAECRTSIYAELKLPADTLLGVGVDRLDYTKGIEERLWAVERLLERFPSYRGRFVFVQLAAPSRTLIDRYRQLDADVERTAARIQERFGRGNYRPIILLRAHHDPPTVFRYYRAAGLCYVSSLHDGMNLVAKEFVAARDDERGVLVLSHFAGASRELTEALIVNPYDLDEAAAALDAALQMPADQQRQRMRALRTLVADFNVYRWAGRMLIDAARLRAQDRLHNRLSNRLVV